MSALTIPSSVESKSFIDPIVGGAIVGGLGSIVGGALSGSAQSAANAANLEWAKKQWQKNYAMQKEFAQHGLQWRSEDAKRAGLHPLAALGVNMSGASPVSVGGEQMADTSAGETARSMGQDISRAITATQTREQRILNNLQLESQTLENSYKRALINKLAKETAMIGPPMPPAVEPGHVSSVGFTKTPGGSMSPIPSEKVKERIEDSPYEWEHYFMNRVVPMLTGRGPGRPDESPGTGRRWQFNGINYVPVPVGPTNFRIPSFMRRMNQTGGFKRR